LKYETKTEEDGKVVLQLGLNHSVGFEKGMDVEGIVVGVETLIQSVVGVSAFELCAAVMTEFAKQGEEK
jgi:hypothetical protein